MNRAWKVALTGLMVLGLRAVDLRAQDESSDEQSSDKTKVEKLDPVADAFATPKNFKPTKVQAELLSRVRQEHEPDVREAAAKLDSSNPAEKTRAEQSMRKMRVKIKAQINRIVSGETLDDPAEKKTEPVKPRREPARVAEKSSGPSGPSGPSAAGKTHRETKPLKTKPTSQPKTNGSRAKSGPGPYSDRSTPPVKKKPSRSE